MPKKDEPIDAAVDGLARDLSSMSLEAADREVYRLLKHGVPVSMPDREHGGQKTGRLRDRLGASRVERFLLVSQLTSSTTKEKRNCRPVQFSRA